MFIALKGTYFCIIICLVNDCRSDVSLVNNSDFDVIIIFLQAEVWVNVNDSPVKRLIDVTSVK